MGSVLGRLRPSTCVGMYAHNKRSPPGRRGLLMVESRARRYAPAEAAKKRCRIGRAKTLASERLCDPGAATHRRQWSLAGDAASFYNPLHAPAGDGVILLHHKEGRN